MADSEPSLHYDCIIIGAGLYGIAAANAYLSLHPDSRLVILESRSCIGGVWSRERVYDGFWTQTPIEMARFSDLPIKHPPKHETYYGYFPARYITHYLSGYVGRQTYKSLSIYQRILFNSKVVKVGFSAATGWWQVLCAGETRPLKTPKLLVAAGLASQPNMPDLPGREDFRGNIIHHVDFGKSPIMQDPKTRHIAVLGGAKSAADVAYTAAKAGKMVTWIIQKSGSGPAHFAPAQGVGPYKNSNELLFTRLTASLSPSIWNPQGWLSWFLHGTRPGLRMVDWVWKNSDAGCRTAAGYRGQRGNDGSGNGFADLEPDTSLFWQNDSTGVNQRSDFWDIIAQKVHVHRQDVVQLTENGIVVREGQIDNVDAIICATGWRPSHERFFDKDLGLDLGLSVPLGSTRRDTNDSHWKQKDEAAEAKISRLFPRLEHPPPYKIKPTDLSPYRLYRNMIPITTEKYPGIIFLGHIAVGNNFRAAEVQALWAVAYLSGMLKLPSQSKMEKEVALALAWCRKRYLSKGQLGHWLYYDLVPYTDRLLEDVGLYSHRQKGRLGDLWRPCLAEDLAGLLGELKEKKSRHEVS